MPNSDEEKNCAEIPRPANEGGDGKQLAATQEIVVAEHRRGVIPLVQQMEGVAARRGFGSETANAFVVGAMRMMQSHNEKLEGDLEQARISLEERSQALSISKQENSVLAERLRAGARTRNLVNFAMVIGTLLLGLGFDQFRQGNVWPGAASAGLGTVLILFSWLSAPEGRVK